MPVGKSAPCECRCLPSCDCRCSCKIHCICASAQADPEACTGDCLRRSRGRNLIVSIDGTSNQFGPYVCIFLISMFFGGYFPDHRTQNTNVVELHSRIVKKSAPQLSLYISGIGTYVPPSSWSITSWKQTIANAVDLAFAWFAS